MKISPELIAIAILGVSLVSLGWKVSSDIRQELKQEIHLVRADVADLRGDVAGLRERMARLEGLFQGFTGRELIKEQP
ncbi:MAG: hypothetical protein OXU26_02840 [Acidobacteriota bacterium]|nr:hypothetical protein [Acidobacteriota bacterium]